MHDIIVSLHMFIEEKKTSVCCASKMGGYSMMFYCLLTTANVNIFFFFEFALAMTRLRGSTWSHIDKE